MYTFQHGSASVSDLQEAPGKSSLDEVLRVTAKTGFYDLGTELILGELAGKPITLSVQPPMQAPMKQAANHELKATDKSAP